MNSNLISRQLLWKDYRQVRPALLGSMFILSAILLINLCYQLSERGNRMDTFQPTYIVALIAPTLAAMACSGLLIGHERQVRTWHWSSSLPIHWTTSLISKSIVWLVSSVVMCALLLLLYALLFRLAQSFGRTGDWVPDLQASRTRLLLWMLVLVPLEVFVFFNIATLLWNDTLLALVMAAVVVALGHVLAVDMLPHWWTGSSAGADFERASAAGSVLLIGWLLLGGIVLCMLFRWRWTSGSMTSLGWPLRRLVPIQVVTSWSAHGAKLNAHTKPTEFGMLLGHACSTFLALRMTTFCGALLIMLWTNRDVGRWYAVGLSAPLLGMSAFTSDQTLRRFRFFADRGVNWLKMFSTHIAVPLAILGLLIAIALLAGNIREETVPLSRMQAMEVVLLFSAFFLVGAFCALCTSSSTIALATTMATIALCAFSFGAVDTLWQTMFAESSMIAIYLPVSFVVLLAAALIQARRWLIQEHTRSVALYVKSVVAGVALPILLCISFAFLRVPLVLWQGLPVDRVSLQSTAKLPNLAIQVPDTPIVPSQEYRDRYRPANAAAALAYQFAYREIADAGDAWVNEWQAALDSLNSELQNPEQSQIAGSVDSFGYSRMIEQLAIVGGYGTHKRNAPLARAALVANRALLKLGQDDFHTLMGSMSARARTWELWSSFNEHDLAWLRSECGDIEQFLPERIKTERWAWTVKFEASLASLWLFESLEYSTHLFRSDGFLPRTLRRFFHYFPPMRWYAERKIALGLSEALEQIHSGKLPEPAQQYRYGLGRLSVGPILELQELERTVAPIVLQQQRPPQTKQ